jgi:hypothetical protein
MAQATSSNKVTNALRKAGYAAECFKGNGYVYFIADDGREIDSVYVCYLYQQTVEQYVEHVAKFFKED